MGRPMTIGDLDQSRVPSPTAWRDSQPIICMTKAEFERLPEYSATMPTGVIPGKRWRRHDGAQSPIKSERERAEWFVLEYSAPFTKDDGKEYCSTLWYRPVLSRDMEENDL